MARFDFITNQEFRVSLESDYRELQVCAKEGAWKSSHVLGGSIVEALLVDYLLAKPELITSGKSPLEIDLNTAISICRSNKALPERTADLCSVIRSYRNLIHPGRQIRLNELAPSENSARIVLSLVDLIIDEIARVREETFGKTAEQILTKLDRDRNALAILSYLLQDVRPTELERLLTDVLPKRHEEVWVQLDVSFDDTDILEGLAHELKRLEEGYRIGFAHASDSVKTRVAARFPSILENEGDRQIAAALSLFRISDLQYVSERDRPMVMQFFLSRLPSRHDWETIDQMSDLLLFLRPSEVSKWLDPFVRTLVSSEKSSRAGAAVYKELMRAAERCWDMPDLLKAVMSRLDDWIRQIDDRADVDQASYLRQLKEDFKTGAEEYIPF